MSFKIKTTTLKCTYNINETKLESVNNENNLGIILETITRILPEYIILYITSNPWFINRGISLCATVSDRLVGKFWFIEKNFPGHIPVLAMYFTLSRHII